MALCSPWLPAAFSQAFSRPRRWITLFHLLSRYSASSPRAASFIWPLSWFYHRHEKPEGTISSFFGVSNIENPESDGTEVNFPTAVVYFLEANPNPEIAADEEFAAASRAVGLDYETMLDRILRLGLQRAARA